MFGSENYCLDPVNQDLLEMDLVVGLGWAVHLYIFPAPILVHLFFLKNENGSLIRGVAVAVSHKTKREIRPAFGSREDLFGFDSII
jgi:hypothetical protein